MTKVMLVEDDNNLREIYEARLQAEGYTIVAAKDGEEALVMAKAEQPDLVISDVMMPKISGFEMLDILRNTEGLKEVKVIMLTALGQSDDQLRADKLGADRYLVKSQVTLEDIIKVTHELLGDGNSPAESDSSTVSVAAEEPASPEAVDKTTPDEPVAAAVPNPVITVVAPPPTEPEPTNEPTPAASAETSSLDEDSQSSAQEEAAVEAKIEDFVVGATSEPNEPIPDEVAPTGKSPEINTSPEAALPTPPEPVVVEPVVNLPETTAEPTTADETVSEPVKPTAEIPPESATVTDDKLMAEAVDTLVANAETTSDSTPELAGKPAAGETAPAIKVDVMAEPAAGDSQADSSNVVISGKKVISPLDSQPKPDLNALLAKEEAKQTGSLIKPEPAPAPETPAAVPTAPPNTIITPAAVPVKPSTPLTSGEEPSIDPNSIAL